MNRGQIRTNIRTNLDDNGVTFYSDAEINDSIQDAYNEIAAFTRCLTKSAANQPWIGNKNYYDFRGDGITDYLGAIAIFNNVTNLWLDDSMSLRDFDKIRRNWETWIGSPQYWTPHSLQYIAVAPKSAETNGTFNLLYWAAAPTIATDSDAIFVASDMQILLEQYGTADLLETAEEPTKATLFWNQYIPKLQKYQDRCKKLAGPDLLLRV